MPERRTNAMLSVPKSKQTLLDEPIRFRFRNIPSKGKLLYHCPRHCCSFPRGPPGRPSRPAQTLGISLFPVLPSRPPSPVLDSNAQQPVPFWPSGAVVLGTIVCGATLLSRSFAAPTGHLSTAVKGFPSGPI